MIIRLATLEDLDDIIAIYTYARKQMHLNGNFSQWGQNNPTKETLMTDIKNKQLYIILNNNLIVGAFALIFGEDPTYKIIDNGAWLNDEPYAAIHRVASNGMKKGIIKDILDFSESKINNIRIDTHDDNKIMQHLLAKYGYQICGTIYAEDGTPRIAYQKIVK